MSAPVDPETGFSRWPWWRRWFGRRSERFAAGYLRKLGYRILAHNLADPRGEIDLLALDGRAIVVVEVRSSEGRDFAKLASSIGRDKQRRVTAAAMRFLHRHRIAGVNLRFDVLLISWPPDGRSVEVRHFPNAFASTDRFQMHS